MNDCIFCKIIAMEIPSTIVYENDRVMAFEDIEKGAPVHVLVVPKSHVESVMDIDGSNIGIISDIHLAIKEVAKKTGVDKTGFRVINNCGKDAGQTVMHIHYHVVGGRPLGIKIV